MQTPFTLKPGGDDEEMLEEEEEEEEEEESFTSSPESDSTSVATSTAKGMITPAPRESRLQLYCKSFCHLMLDT